MALLTLPAELLIIISTYLTECDLLEYALTCRHLSTVAAPRLSFFRTAFSDPAISHLNDIHPSRLLRTLRELLFPPRGGVGRAHFVRRLEMWDTRFSWHEWRTYTHLTPSIAAEAEDYIDMGGQSQLGQAPFVKEELEVFREIISTQLRIETRELPNPSLWCLHGYQAVYNSDCWVSEIAFGNDKPLKVLLICLLPHIVEVVEFSHYDDGSWETVGWLLSEVIRACSTAAAIEGESAWPPGLLSLRSLGIFVPVHRPTIEYTEAVRNDLPSVLEFYQFLRLPHLRRIEVGTLNTTPQLTDQRSVLEQIDAEGTFTSQVEHVAVHALMDGDTSDIKDASACVDKLMVVLKTCVALKSLLIGNLSSCNMSCDRFLVFLSVAAPRLEYLQIATHSYHASVSLAGLALFPHLRLASIQLSQLLRWIVDLGLDLDTELPPQLERLEVFFQRSNLLSVPLVRSTKFIDFWAECRLSEKDRSAVAEGLRLFVQKRGSGGQRRLRQLCIPKEVLDTAAAASGESEQILALRCACAIGSIELHENSVHGFLGDTHAPHYHCELNCSGTHDFEFKRCPKTVSYWPAK